MPIDADPDCWARLRFAIIGPLLAAPPPPGELRQRLEALANSTWKHPVNGMPVRFSYATIERWFYCARHAQDPVGVLRRRRRCDAGQVRKLTPALIAAVHAQYHNYPSWSVQLHYDNLAALVEEVPALGVLPSYATVRRYMKARGLQRKRQPKHNSPGTQQAQQRLQGYEVRSFETAYTHGLWHLDYHHGSRRVVTRSGRWVTPKLLCVIDDHSRLVCHLQWYLAETTETLVHGLSQAFQKRALPAALMTDNGSAMQAAEFLSGLHTLSIQHEPTLPYSPHQNAKQETFWATLEGRLMAMLKGVTELTLERLNQITQAWVEFDYHRAIHSEIATTPLRRYLDSRHVGRDCPDSATLTAAFRCLVKRRQRRSDGTLSLEGKRFEVPSRYRHLQQLNLCYARWDLRTVDLVDPLTRASLCRLYPLDKTANASGQRRTREPISPDPNPTPQTAAELPPLLRKLLAEYAATGLPPAYLPQHPDDTEPDR